MAIEFVDKVRLHIRAGRGGNGCTSIHREKFKPLGGPDGANGGNGGNVILRAEAQTTTLLPYQRSPHRHAESGTHGKGDLRHGAHGSDLVLAVPCGTVVKDDTGTFLVDLREPGDSYLAARGGKGGLGNAALASPTRKAPGFALLGEPGETAELTLEVKTLADVALIGYPSAGKSSLVAALSAARPKIAEYPFTTLVPQLGVVEAGNIRYTIADVPGLIPGAAEGKGLGLEFLRHVERCSVLVHVIDMATWESSRDPLEDLRVIEQELSRYAADVTPDGSVNVAADLVDRPRLVAFNKVDIPDGADLADIVRPDFQAAGYEVYDVSAVSHQGLKEFSYAVANLVATERERIAALPQEPQRVTIQPVAADTPDFEITREQEAGGEIFRVLGDKPMRWIQQTDFTNDEAVGYLADRLNRLGVEEELVRIGATAGSTVVIGGEDGVIFDWDPSITGAAQVMTSRGSDMRLEVSTRSPRHERKAAFHERMDAKTRAREAVASGEAYQEPRAEEADDSTWYRDTKK